jgi:hypothetical protein
MSNYRGDYEAGTSVDFIDDTVSGASPFTLSGSPALKAYRSGDTTGSTAGITLSVDYNGTGLHRIVIDLTQDYYTPGHDYMIKFTAGAVDGVSVVGRIVADFSVENRFVPGDEPITGEVVPMATNIWRGTAVAKVGQKVFPVQQGSKPFKLVRNNQSLSFSTWNAVIIAKAINSNVNNIPEFSEVVATALGDGSLLLTDATPGLPAAELFNIVVEPTVTIEINRLGVDPISEIQLITLPATTTGGTWDLQVTVNGVVEVYDTLDHDITAAELEDEIEAHAEVGTGNVEVTGVAGGPWSVKYKNDLAGVDIPLMVGSGDDLTGNASVVVTTIQNGASSDEIGYFQMGVYLIYGVKFSYGGNTTAVITYGASTATIKAAIEALPGIGSGNIEVYGGFSKSINNFYGGSTSYGIFMVFKFTGSLAGQNVNALQMLRQYDPISSPDYNQTINATMITQGGTSFANTLVFIDARLNSGTSPSDTWTITVDGQTTSALSVRATTSEIDTAVTALSTVASVTVYGNSSASTLSKDCQGLYLLNFDGGDAGTDISPVSITLGGGLDPASTVGATVVNTGGASSEIQEFYITAAGGTFDVGIESDTASGIAYGASAATLQTALEATSGVGSGDVIVTGSGTESDPYRLEYAAALGGLNLAQVTVDISSITGGKDIAISNTQAPVAGVSMIEIIRIYNADGGTVLLTRNGIDVRIDWDATAVEVQTAFETLQGAGNAQVEGPNGGPWIITSIGDMANRAVGPLLYSTFSLTSSNGFADATRYPSEGPEYYNVPSNWSLGRVPQPLDEIIFDRSAKWPKYGTIQRCEVTANATLNRLSPVDTHDLIRGQIVRIKSSGTLPGGLTADTDYYIQSLDPVDGSFALTASYGGDAINISSTGSGTHKVFVPLANIVFLGAANYVGISQLNKAGYYDDRKRYLGIDTADNGTCSIGVNTGAGPSLLRIDFDDSQVNCDVISTSTSSESGTEPVILLNDNDNSEVNIYGGTLGIATEIGQESTVGRVFQSGGSFVANKNLEITQLYDKIGGTVNIAQLDISGVFRERRR